MLCVEEFTCIFPALNVRSVNGQQGFSVRFWKCKKF